MNFDELDETMRVFETAHDHCVLPGLFIVARLDGRGFTRLTKEVHQFEAPFDVRFRDMMIATTSQVMQCGFRAIYGYTQSDEISILFHREEDSFGRKMRKWDSILAGEASATFSLRLGAPGCFDCRLSLLATPELVIDYFRWRNEDAARNALNAHCYWMLRKQGQAARQADGALIGMSVAQKNELLYANGINFNDLPNWQKRGTGIYWETFQKEAMNPQTNRAVIVDRRRLKMDMELPMKDDYSAFVSGFVAQAMAK